MSTASDTNSLINSYQKYFSMTLLKTAVQLTVLDQFGLRQGMPKKKGTKIISFFRRIKSKLNSAGRVAAVQSLTEGVPIGSYQYATLDRVDVTLLQFGEAAKITDIVSMTELFDALKQNSDLISEDCALNADSIVRDALVSASASGLNSGTAGVVLTQPDGSGGTTTTTETISQLYSQSATSFSTLNGLSQSGGKAVATDFIRAATQLKINRAPTFSGMYVAVVPPQVSGDLQNDPDWIDAVNYGDPSRRFRGEIKSYAGCRFVEATNPFQEDCTGTEGVYASAATAANRAYRTWILGQGAYGVPAIEGDSPFNPRMIIVNTPDKTDPLNQFMTAGWKAFWAASGLNCPYAISLTSKSEMST